MIEQSLAKRIAYKVADTAMRGMLRAAPPTSLTEKIALSWGFRVRPISHMVTLRSGLAFHCQEGDYIDMLLDYVGVFEPAVIELMRRLLRPGDIALDVGANVGFHTLECWREVGKSGRVISIEAVPKHVTEIRRNLAANGFPADHVINVAVGDHEGEVRLGMPDGDGNGGQFTVNGTGDQSFTAPLRRIDDLVGDLPGLALIKMDIEGSELAALRGAANTIGRHKPAIIIELNDAALARNGASAAEVVKFLNDAGYSGRKITRKGLLPLTGDHACDECLFQPQAE